MSTISQNTQTTSVSASPPKVAPQLYDNIRALLRAGKNDQAIARACAINVILPDDLLAKELLFNGFFQKRDWLPALAVANDLVQCQPGIARLESLRIATLSNLKRYDEAIAHAFQYITRYGEDVMMLDALKVAHFYTGKNDEAIRFGQRAMELQDEAACRNAPDITMIEPKGPPIGRNVICFSLWGSKLVYCYGAMINLVLSRTVYPDWTCRYYVDAAVPRRCVTYLRDNGAEIFNIEDAYPNAGQFQRFLVMNDTTVGRFLIRDCDARLSFEEANLVDEWINSGDSFHVIRGHILHNALMMAGLWGGRTDTGIDIVALMRRYFAAGPTTIYGEDQRMLGSMLWPLIRTHCLVHDKYYALPGIDTLGLPELKTHFGAGHQNPNAVRSEAEQLGIPREL
jgi:tetratricopeptide (TPR) repeat protein